MRLGVEVRLPPRVRVTEADRVGVRLRVVGVRDRERVTLAVRLRDGVAAGRGVLVLVRVPVTGGDVATGEVVGTAVRLRLPLPVPLRLGVAAGECDPVPVSVAEGATLALKDGVGDCVPVPVPLADGVPVPVPLGDGVPVPVGVLLPVRLTVGVGLRVALAVRVGEVVGADDGDDVGADDGVPVCVGAVERVAVGDAACCPGVG